MHDLRLVPRGVTHATAAAAAADVATRSHARRREQAHLERTSGRATSLHQKPTGRVMAGRRGLRWPFTPHRRVQAVVSSAVMRCARVHTSAMADDHVQHQHAQAPKAPSPLTVKKYGWRVCAARATLRRPVGRHGVHDACISQAADGSEAIQRPTQRTGAPHKRTRATRGERQIKQRRVFKRFAWSYAAWRNHTA
jgi:hypothetical protein